MRCSARGMQRQAAQRQASQRQASPARMAAGTDTGGAALIATHNMDLAARMDRVIRLGEGGAA